MNIFIVYLYGVLISDNILLLVTFYDVYFCEWGRCGWRDESSVLVLFMSEMCIDDVCIVGYVHSKRSHQNCNQCLDFTYILPMSPLKKQHYVIYFKVDQSKV